METATAATHLYMVTAQKPTSVTHSLSGNFTGPDDLNLIIVKATHLELYLVVESSLKLIHDVPLNGRVTVMRLVRPPNRTQTCLFLVNERYHCCLLSFDRTKWELVNEYSGEVMDRIGRPDENGHIGIVDPECRMLGLRLYTGLFKVLPFDNKYMLKDAVNFRMEELQVSDMTFLYGCSRPTLALIYEDQYERRHVKCYELHFKDKEFKESWSLNHVEGGSQMLIPVPMPYGGVIIVGEQIISYYNGEGSPISVSMKPSLMKAFDRLDTDGRRYLLGDHYGNLYLLLLLEDHETHHRVTNLVLERLGEVSIPSSICYLGHGMVFIGSAYSNSQLIRLNIEKSDQMGDYVTVLESYTNIGPIVDFVVVDLEKQGQVCENDD
jgi:DNA damage-binding protein 1